MANKQKYPALVKRVSSRIIIKIREIMRFITSKTHGLLDYLTSPVYIVSPWLFGFAIGGVPQLLPMIVGIMAIAMSLLTDYEKGIVKVLPFSFHLGTDVLTGAFLAASPWIFGFADQVFIPHLILGLFEMGAGLFTKTVPEYKILPAR